MDFDINELLAQMSGAIKDSVKEDWPEVKKAANTFLKSRKERLDLLISLRLMNQIEPEFFELRLKDEKKILESELHSLAIITKVVAQNAANAALAVLNKTVNAALGIIS